MFKQTSRIVKNAVLVTLGLATDDANSFFFIDLDDDSITECNCNTIAQVLKVVNVWDNMGVLQCK